MFLLDPPEDPAVTAFYGAAHAADGYVMNLLRLWAWRPDVHAAFLGARKAVVENTTLSPSEIAVLNAATAAQRNDAYCSIAWGTRVAEAVDADAAGAVLRGEEPIALSDREIALARWARVVAKDPNAATSDDVEALRAAQLSEREIFEATFVIALRLAFTSVNSALGAQPDRQLAAQAPASVLDAVTFGRTVEPHASSVSGSES